MPALNWETIAGADPALQMGLIVVGLLILSGSIVALMKWRNPQGDFTELSQRIRSWWFMAGFFFLGMLVHKDLALVMFGALSFLALKEYFTLIGVRPEDHRALFWAYLAVPLQYVWIFMRWKPMFFIFIPVYMFLYIPLRLILKGEPKGILSSMSRIQWGLMAFVFCISHVALLLTLPATDATPGGRALVLYLVFLTEINDVSQYVWGKLFGKTPIAPTISPKKTRAGLVGGILTTSLAACLLSFLSGFPIFFSVLAGVLISLSGFTGDLVMSSLKRDIGVKDASQLIPGHGGMLDRIDSLTYTAPLFFHFVSYFYYPALR